MPRNLKEQITFIEGLRESLANAERAFKVLARDCKFSGRAEGECYHVHNISDNVDRCNSKDCPFGE